MTASRVNIIVAALACLWAAGAALGQEAATDTPPDVAPPAGEAAPASEAPTIVAAAMPEVGELITAVDKASAGAGATAGDWSTPVKLAVVFAGLAIIPSVLVLMTSFTRIVIVLAFLRRALTTQNIPPTVAIIGLALFLTIFTMSPTFSLINAQALQPYLADQMSLAGAFAKTNELLKDFMLRQTRKSDLALFVKLANVPAPQDASGVPMYVAVPSFAISEFRTAFEMGCLLFVPFLVIDLVIASILLSAGMMMLPPAMISLPFKIILFVLVDGWALLAKTLVGSFNY